ncbi:MAG: GTP 3',8-cyclase MoaA [Candidatus Verstraetearchaeota archaeon]|nr:GTP 3',8-cyclase MoaA [Candidatus Verstraetearchaeota archaeon]
MIDPYNRKITGLRISITQRCNLNCKYCHHEGEEKSSREMKCEEIIRIIKIAKNMGIRRVKFTGGEPLIRDDIGEIIKKTIDIGLEDVAITTNGSLLNNKIDELFRAGLRRLNISIPSLNPHVYSYITGGNLLDVISGVHSAIRKGMNVKINTVIMKGINDNEIYEFINFASSLRCSLQLIELEKLNINDDFFEKHYIDLSFIEKILENLAEEVIVREDMNDRKVYVVNGIPIEVVRPTYPNFCKKCSRIRITSDGKIKPCLMRNDNLVDILTPMRNGASDEEIEKLFIKAVMLRAPYYK